jgi:hypothetical protein
MTMPETAVNQDDGFILGEHQIRLPRKIRNVYSVAKARRVKSRTYNPFRHRIFPAYAGHHPRTSRFVYYICH